MQKRTAKQKGFVYILRDSHFKGVKIGKARNVERRIRPMLTANPWLSVYVKIETEKWGELERTVHNVIKLVAKRKQVGTSEFYVIEPEKAKQILLEFGRLFDRDDFIIHDVGACRHVSGKTKVPMRKTSARPQQLNVGRFPYKVGQLCRALFPKMFKEKLIKSSDIHFLLSADSAKVFKTRGAPILMLDAGDSDALKDAKGHLRYYSGTLLRAGGKQYRISNSLYKESLAPILGWVTSRGISYDEARAICDSVYAC